MAFGRSEERCDHIVGVCGKTLYCGGDGGVNVKETANRALRLTTAFEGRLTR